MTSASTIEIPIPLNVNPRLLNRLSPNEGDVTMRTTACRMCQGVGMSPPPPKSCQRPTARATSTAITAVKVRPFSWVNGLNNLLSISIDLLFNITIHLIRFGRVGSLRGLQPCRCLQGEKQN